MKESVLIREYASSCIDSSDGVLNALISLSEINTTGFELTRIPYLSKGLAACRVLSKPRELLFAGECGEYELVFTIPGKDLSTFLNKAAGQHLNITPIGRMTENPERTLNSMRTQIDFTPFEIRGRDYENISLYLEELTHYLKSHEKSRRKL
jgi:thiamine-monophosphate kinase